MEQVTVWKHILDITCEDLCRASLLCGDIREWVDEVAYKLIDTAGVDSALTEKLLSSERVLELLSFNLESSRDTLEVVVRDASGAPARKGQVIDGVWVYFSDDTMSQGAYYPEGHDAADRRPFVVLPFGADPGPAVAKVKAKMMKDIEMPGMLSSLISQLLAIHTEHGDMRVFTGDMIPVELEVVTTPEEPEKHGPRFLHVGP